MAYHMLREAAAKRTEFVVVEAAVDTEGILKPELPAELIDLLQQTFDREEELEENPVRVYLYCPSPCELINLSEFVWKPIGLDASVRSVSKCGMQE